MERCLYFGVRWLAIALFGGALVPSSSLREKSVGKPTHSKARSRLHARGDWRNERGTERQRGKVSVCICGFGLEVGFLAE